MAGLVVLTEGRSLGALLGADLGPLLLLDHQVEILDDLLGFDVQVRLDVADGALLPLGLPQQGLLRRHQFVHRTLGTHQHVPHLSPSTPKHISSRYLTLMDGDGCYLVHFLGDFEERRHFGVEGVQFALGGFGFGAAGRGRGEGLRCGGSGVAAVDRRVQQRGADVAHGRQHLVHLLREEFDEDLEVTVHAGHARPQRIHLLVVGARAAGRLSFNWFYRLFSS